MRSVGGDPWTARYALERLTQLRADVESACNRYVTECLREALVDATPDKEEQWMRTASNSEKNRDDMLRDIDKWITRLCGEQSG